MREERKALGATLEDLGIGDLLSSIQQQSGGAAAGNGEAPKACMLDINTIQPNPFQPRKFFSAVELENLAVSIREQGLLQPVVVRPSSHGGYELIAGERRLRASQIAGMQTIAAVVRTITDKACLILALIENIQREQLNPVELAESLQSMVQRYGMTHAEVGRLIGKSRASVSNTIRLIQLDESIKNMLIQGLLDMGHARSLLAVPCDMQMPLAEKIVHQSLSVRQAEDLVRKALRVEAENDHAAEPAKSGAVYDRAKKAFSDYFGVQIVLRQQSGKDGGWLGLPFESEKNLEKLLEKLNMQ